MNGHTKKYQRFRGGKIRSNAHSLTAAEGEIAQGMALAPEAVRERHQIRIIARSQQIPSIYIFQGILLADIALETNQGPPVAGCVVPAAGDPAYRGLLLPGDASCDHAQVHPDEADLHHRAFIYDHKCQTAGTIDVAWAAPEAGFQRACAIWVHGVLAGRRSAEARGGDQPKGSQVKLIHDRAAAGPVKCEQANCYTWQGWR